MISGQRETAVSRRRGALPFTTVPVRSGPRYPTSFCLTYAILCLPDFCMGDGDEVSGSTPAVLPLSGAGARVRVGSGGRKGRWGTPRHQRPQRTKGPWCREGNRSVAAGVVFGDRHMDQVSVGTYLGHEHGQPQTSTDGVKSSTTRTDTRHRPKTRTNECVGSGEVRIGWEPPVP